MKKLNQLFVLFCLLFVNKQYDHESVWGLLLIYKMFKGKKYIVDIVLDPPVHPNCRCV